MEGDVYNLLLFVGVVLVLLGMSALGVRFWAVIQGGGFVSFQSGPYVIKERKEYRSTDLVSTYEVYKKSRFLPLFHFVCFQGQECFAIEYVGQAIEAERLKKHKRIIPYKEITNRLLLKEMGK